MGNNQIDGPGTPANDDRPTRRSRLKTAFKAAVVVAAVVVVGAGVVLYLAQSEPNYWKAHQQLLNESTPEQLEQLAEEVNDQLQQLATVGLDTLNAEASAVEYSLNSMIDPEDDLSNTQDDVSPDVTKPEDIRIDQDQTLTLTNKQLAAVVQTRMDDWLGSRGYVKPEQIKDPMIAVNGDGLVMAFLIQTDVFSQVVSGRFDLVILDDGMAELTMQRFLLGNLPVPADALGEHLRSYTQDDRAVEAGEWLEKLQYMRFKPVIELDHRRRARVQDYKLLEKGLELTVRVQDHKTYKAMNTALAGVPTD